MKIKKGDTVLMVQGKDRGRKGKVIKVLPKGNKIIVEGLNIIKKHIRPRREGEKGQIVKVPRPVDVSNTKLICPRCKKPTRIGYKILNQRKYRICKKCSETFE